MEDKLCDILLEGAAAFGLTLDAQVLSGFGLFYDELAEWNKVMNLTAIKVPEEIVIKHFIDSLSLLRYAELPQGAALIDVGCGAGFPGIPLKLARPDIRLTCVDSLNKRLLFIVQLAEKLKFKDCACLHLRAEEAGRRPELRGGFDVAAARAVGSLRVLAELCLPLVKKGGVFCAMKGPGAAAETAEAARAVRLLGGELERTEEFELPQTDMGRTIVIIRKRRDTPGAYPRINAQIIKDPL